MIDRVGYDWPMMFGLTVMFFSTLLFAVGDTYSMLFFARALQVSCYNMVVQGVLAQPA